MTKFKIHIPNRLHYSMTTHNNRKDSCQGFYDNIAKFPNVVEGMRIEVKNGIPNKACEICTQGKFPQSRKRQPDTCITSVFELLHTLSRPFGTNWHKWIQIFYNYKSLTNDFSVQCLYIFLETQVDSCLPLRNLLPNLPL